MIAGNAKRLLRRSPIRANDGIPLQGLCGRWMAATLLTAVCGGVLMSGALYVSLEGQQNFARTPALVTANAAMQGVQKPAGERKGDRISAIPLAADTNFRLVKAGTLARDGATNIVKPRSFAHITMALMPYRGALTQQVPAFDPSRYATAAAKSRLHEEERFYDAAVDGEVAFQTRSFDDRTIALDAYARPSLTQIEHQVLDVMTRADSPVPAAAFAFPGLASAAAADATLSGLTSLGSTIVRIEEANVSVHAQTSPRNKTIGPLREETVLIEPGMTLETLLREFGNTPNDVEAITSAIAQAQPVSALKAGQRLVMALGRPPGGGGERPLRISFYNDRRHVVSVGQRDTGRYVLAKEPVWSTLDEHGGQRDRELPESGAAVNLYTSLYQTALQRDLSEELRHGIIQMFAFDVDLQSKARDGDMLEMLYAMPETPATDDTSEVLYAALTHNGTTYRRFRFFTADDSRADYYDETGRSARKFLLRKPVAQGRFSSGYGNRRHPLLRRSRLHTGVDWSAPRGTPIVAAGDGTVSRANWAGGYGRYLTIKHANGYATSYAHMARFARGIKPGARVSMGEVVGYVGTTGLSTGPHLHFEVRVNNKLVDPMRIRLPRGRILAGEQKAQFFVQRDQVENLIRDSAKTAAFIPRE